MLEVFFHVFRVFILAMMFCLISGAQSDPRGSKNEVQSEEKVIQNEGQNFDQKKVPKKCDFWVPGKVKNSEKPLVFQCFLIVLRKSAGCKKYQKSDLKMTPNR